MAAADIDHLLALLTLQVLVIIAAARLLGAVVARGRQPQVIGEVLAGLLLGPSCLGWLAPHVSAGLFPPSSWPFLKTLSEIGIVFFMFLVGLEFDPQLLRRRGRMAAVISAVSMLVPFVFGAATAWLLYDHIGAADVAPTSFAIFLGAAMAITAFPVLARILAEHDLLHTPLGAMALTCAAFDDAAGWCLLSVIASIGPRGGGAAAGTLICVVLFVVAMGAIVRPALQGIQARFARAGTISTDLLALIFMLLLASTLVTQWLGLHAIFGAFALGVAMPKQHAFVRNLAAKLEDVTVVFFLPVYFAYTGLRTQIGLLDSPTAWVICALLIAVAVAGKFGGSVLGARYMGMGWRPAAALGALVNTRGLMGLIILNVGLDLGLITPQVFAMMVLMAVVTTLMTSPALAMLIRTPAQTRDLAGD